MSNKHCSICTHLRTVGTEHGPHTFYVCDEVKKSITSDSLYMSSVVLEIKLDALKTFYCKHFTRKGRPTNG